MLPSGEMSIALNGLPGDFTEASTVASASRQSRATPSSHVVSACVPSAERSSDETQSGCLSTTLRSSWPVARSHWPQVRSPLAVMSRWPSGVNRIAVIEPL